MRNFKEHLIFQDRTIKQALLELDKLAKDAILFVVDSKQRLIGSLTDGDVRRGLLKGVNIDENVLEIIQKSPRFIRKGANDIQKVIQYREGNFKILPVLDVDDKVVNVINFRFLRSYLPVDAIIMAGGRGSRLRPLTDNTPKPLLKIGEKPIIEYNIDRLALYGIDDFWISVKYLGEQIKNYFEDGSQKGVQIDYVWEDEPLGTIGAVSKIQNFQHDSVLITNSDLLTNLDYEYFYLDFLKKEADFAVVTIPYLVNIPYAVVETDNGQIHDFTEKPTYTYYSNGGIYLVKRELLDYIPKGEAFNATDFMEKLIALNKKVISYPHNGYWLDIGKPADFAKAKNDISQIKF